MTCRKCSHNFCWLCLGDYPHRDNGSGLCNNFQDAQRRNGQV